MAQSSSNSGCTFGCGGLFTTLLTILFIGLKLGGVIDWGWVWVLSPLWISLSVSLLFAIAVFAFIVFLAIIKVAAEK